MAVHHSISFYFTFTMAFFVIISSQSAISFPIPESATQLVFAKFSDVYEVTNKPISAYEPTYNSISDVYEDTYNSVSDTLETYKPNTDAVSKFFSDAYNTVTNFLSDKTIITIIIAVGILIVLIAVPTILIAILNLLKFVIVGIVRLLGFGTRGIVKGSCAAAVMAMYGGRVAVNSICA